MTTLEFPESPILKVDAWHGPSGPLPAHAQFVCAYEVHLGVDGIEERAFLVQGETDQLWTISDLMPAGLAVTARHQPDGEQSAAVLLDALFDARVGFAWPTKHLNGGIIDQTAFAAIVGNLEARLDARAAAAHAYGDAPIVLAARECQLDPRPSGTSPIAWMANCPGTNHWLMIGADTNTWGCGWCKRKGGPEELRVFVAERRAKQTSVPPNSRA